MFAALFWTGNLYIADRRAFVNEELPNLDEAIFKNNKNFLNGGKTPTVSAMISKPRPLR